MTHYGTTQVSLETHQASLRLSAESITRSGLLALKEARPTVQLIVTLRLCTALLLLAPEALLRPTTVRGIAAFVAANSAVYLFNGLCDQVEDRRNGKDRPLARGDLTRAAARRWLVLLVVTSLLLATHGGPLLVAIVCGQLVAGWVYSWTPLAWMRRQTWPLVLISYAGLATYCSAAVLSGAVVTPGLFLLALSMTAWMTGVGGILKDLPDVAGDRAAGRCTTAVRHGVLRAAWSGRACAWACAVGLLVGAVTLHSAPLAAAAGVLVCSASVIHRGTRRTAITDERRLKSPYRAFMRGQYGAHLACAAVCLVGI